jgi:hypothetical protein
MKRIHFIEIGDDPWCPRGIRRGVTDFCRFVTEHSGLFNAVAPLSAGAHRSRFTASGKNPAATGYQFGIDAIDLFD